LLPALVEAVLAEVAPRLVGVDAAGLAACDGVLHDIDRTGIGCRQRDRVSRTRSNNLSERRTSPGPCSSPPPIT